jgi:hypothetical protein
MANPRRRKPAARKPRPPKTEPHLPKYVLDVTLRYQFRDPHSAQAFASDLNNFGIGWFDRDVRLFKLKSKVAAQKKAKVRKS